MGYTILYYYNTPMHVRKKQDDKTPSGLIGFSYMPPRQASNAHEQYQYATPDHPPQTQQPPSEEEQEGLR